MYYTKGWAIADADTICNTGSIWHWRYDSALVTICDKV